LSANQLVEVGIPPLDEPFTGTGHVRQGNRTAAVAAYPLFEARLIGEGVDQPGLAIRLLEDVIDHPALKRLPGLLGLSPLWMR